ncbi:CAF1 family ribonuclease-domain-containing protein [Kalaharituber pfeilii]|nr:CAF1 family ribonuclease-domain-containing protein [Kalaharituber pfeilii]
MQLSSCTATLRFHSRRFGKLLLFSQTLFRSGTLPRFLPWPAHETLSRQFRSGATKQEQQPAGHGNKKPYIRSVQCRIVRGKFTSGEVTDPDAIPRPPTIAESMQLTSTIFDEQRPEIIEKLRRSMFVAFDLEFSGVGKPKTGLRQPPRTKQSLQECYQAMKEAVEMYQLLQVGLCPVEWNEGDKNYIASPINIYVSPIVAQQNFNVDRVFSLQSSTLAFLANNGFDFNTQLRQGVPYLTREEEKNIRATWQEEETGKQRPTPIDPSLQQFADDCIKALEEWENDPDAPWDFINITTDRNLMSNYQRLIVHQIVKTRFPKLQSVGKSTFVCVTRANEEMINKRKAESEELFNQQLDSAIGLRHIVDELFDPKRPDGRRTVLVGHNLFMDLLHLYNCFIGKLPDKVEEFVHLIHTSFPIVIDTKYLATCHDDSATANSASTLQLLESLLRFQANPKILLHPDHTQYASTTEAYHEAGYDAFITSSILIKIAARLAYETGFEKQEPLTDAWVSRGPQLPQARFNFLSLSLEKNEAYPDNVEKIPSFYCESSDKKRFWAPYMNRLRLFNTEGGELRLS